MGADPLSGSFRDPSGFVFRREGKLLRQVQEVFAPTWVALNASGLIDDLQSAGQLVRHEDVSLDWALRDGAHAVIQPEEVPFISFPYEWSFSQLREAAVLTLDVMEAALARGFWLRDASAFNVQFLRGKPVLIDTLSLGEHDQGAPWPAYGQFCRHFLAPLALMALVDGRMNQMLRVHLDGIPLDLASKLLPLRSRFSLGLGVHVHLHGRAQSPARTSTSSPSARAISKEALLGMIGSIRSAILGLKPPSTKTVWGSYYDETNYSSEAFEAKKSLVRSYLEHSHRETGIVWDLGANSGVFSRVAAERARLVVSWDFDPRAVEDAWTQNRSDGITNIVPLLQDLTNPSPSLGWRHRERPSLQDRGPADVVMALALVHHLAIANNVPLSSFIGWLAELAPWAIVEFVPKRDSQVIRLLSSREDIFKEYSEAGFEASLEGLFHLRQKQSVPGTERTLYLLERI